MNMTRMLTVFAVGCLCIFMAALIPTTETAPVSSADRNEATNYLRKYGYMAPGLMPNDVSTAEQTLKEAILRFQEFFGLPETGELDENTLNFMQKPRCGMRDLDIFENHSRKKRYAVSSDGVFWDKSELTYNVIAYTADTSNAVVDAELAKAFKQWEAVIPIDFRRVSFSPADIEIKFGIGEHGHPEDPFDVGLNVLAHAFYPKIGDAHFNDHFDWWDGDDIFNWTTKEFTKINIYHVALHEFGHSLGLNHSTYRAANMWPVNEYQPNRTLDEDDIEGVQSLYGPRMTTIEPDTSTDVVTSTTTKMPSTAASNEFCPGQLLICEGQVSVVRCPSGSTVQIQTGMFGRLDRLPCDSQPITTAMSSNCPGDSPTVTAALRARCNGKNACKVYSGNPYLGGDPCPETIKYLKFCYTCV